MLATTRQPPVPPPVFDASAESLLLACERLIREGKAVQDAIVAHVTIETATFANTLLPLANEENRRLYEGQLIEFYATVSTDAAARSASHKAEELFSKFDTETAWRSDLYTLLAALRCKNESCDSESQRLLEKMVSSFEQNGLALPKNDRLRFLDIDRALHQIKQDYVKGCDEQHGELWLSQEELEGVKPSLYSGTEHESVDGKIRIHLDEPRSREFMKCAICRESRRRAYIERANSHITNVALLKKAISLRQEKARLLGFADFNHLRMAVEMEKSPHKVQKFLEDLIEQILPSNDVLMKKCRQLKQADLESRNEPDDGRFYEWDHSYYWHKLLASEETVDSKSVVEYFALPETIKRMLSVFEIVMGMTFVELEKRDRPPSSTWHADVQLFAVWDNSAEEGHVNEFMGYLYMDMHPRKMTKSDPVSSTLILKHALESGLDSQINQSAQYEHAAYTDIDGSRKYTATALVCNFPKPSDQKPCLLHHEQIVLLFHELGHAIHDLVAKTKYARFHGASCEDFNEAPSQMLEEWCWHPETLQRLSCHYSTLSPTYRQTWLKEIGDQSNTEIPTQLPMETIEKIIRTRQASTRSKCLVTAHMSLFDFLIYNSSSPQAVEALDTTQLWHDLTKKCFGIDTPPDHVPAPAQAGLSVWLTISGMHIYLTTQVYAQDMFDLAFKADPMNKEEGLRYRRMVIGKGSSQDAMEMLSEYLGRPPKPDAFYARLGL